MQTGIVYGSFESGRRVASILVIVALKHNVRPLLFAVLYSAYYSLVCCSALARTGQRFAGFLSNLAIAICFRSKDLFIFVFTLFLQGAESTMRLVTRLLCVLLCVWMNFARLSEKNTNKRHQTQLRFVVLLKTCVIEPENVIITIGFESTLSFALS